jgi:aspartate carbamoyltransferase regulatory subunit
MDYADFYCQCEACFDKQAESAIQYRPIITKGKVVLKCPYCGASTGQTMIRGKL